MPTKRILSWSKRQSSSEPYYRTGGLLAIESVEPEPNDYETKTTLRVEKRRPANLAILPSDDKQNVCSPVTSQYNAAVVGAATILHSSSNDMLRSPVPSTSPCSRSTSLLQKPLPCRPRSASVPSIAELPAELPGSLLLENQGFPSSSTPISARPTTQILRRESHPPDKHLSHESVSLDALDLVPAQLNHTRSVPELSSRYSIIKTIPSGDELQSAKATQVDLSTEADGTSSSKARKRRRSRPDLITSLSSTHGKASMNKGGMQSPSQMWLGQGKRVGDRDAGNRRYRQNEAFSASNPSVTRSRHIEELKATIATQGQTISIFQSQSTSLRSSCESRVASLVESHSAEVASLKNYVRILEEQVSKHGLHHASSNNALTGLDTIGTPHTPTRDTAQVIVDTVSASPIEPENKEQSPQRLETSLEMENLKRKLSSTRRPETTTRNLLPELNQYKQNNVALQQQIESLMAKLNESKKSERELRNILGMTEMKCAEFEDKATHADKLAKTTQALQNTIDHLENRLEIANTKRLDTEEQLSNLRSDKSPFDFSPPKSHLPSSAHQATFGASMNTNTVFPGTSIVSSELDSQENSALAAFVAHMERLQDQVREKDLYIAELEKERQQLRQTHIRLERDHNKVAIHSGIQNQSQEARRIDTYMEQLRDAVLNRESLIEEKDRDLRAVERQLEHHKLLLQAEIRRHAAMKLHMATEDDSLPELTSLARREDIDRWMDRLHERLRREQSKKKEKTLTDTPDVQVESMRNEIDFYIREIILFKLDIKGYKSDIRKLKKITAQMEAYGRTGGLESEACSLRQTATSVHLQFAPPTPELSSTASPVVDNNHTRTTTDDLEEGSVTLSPSAPSRNLDYVATVPRNSRELDIPTTLHGTTHGDDCTVENDRIDCGVSSYTAGPRSAKCREPTVRTLMVS